MFQAYQTAEVGYYFENASKRPSDYELLNPTITITDLVRTATAAARAGVGSLVWATWQPGGAGTKPKRSSSIASGAMLIMLDSSAARRIAENMQEIEE